MYFGLVLACLLSSFLQMRILDGRGTGSFRYVAYVFFGFFLLVNFMILSQSLLASVHLPHHGNLRR